jgi:hypothetical protein
MVPTGRVRALLCGVLALVVVVTGTGVVDAGADDPATAPPSTVAESTTTPAPAVAPTTTQGGPTTSGPEAPPVTSGPGGFGPPRTDPDAPPEPPMPDPSPEVRILLEQLLDQKHDRAVVHQAHVDDLNRADVARYEGREAAVRATIARSRAALARTNARIRKAEAELRADALARYMDPGTTGIQRMIDTKDTSGRTRAVLVEVNIGLHLDQRAKALADRKAVQTRIEKQNEALARAKRATDGARARAKKAADWARLAADKVAEEQRLVLVANLDGASAASSRPAVLRGAASDWSLPIAGQSVFTATELAQWFVQRGFPSRARAPITDLAKYYIDEGRDQGIRGDMAVAQSVLETGSFTNRDTIALNNFAGIGHCDSCASGFAFATPQLGVRAQIQLLADYTQRNVKLAHPLVDRRLHGPSGCCQTWWQLTHTWATAGNYGPKIMGIYREMLYWLVSERGMTPLVGPR